MIYDSHTSLNSSIFISNKTDFDLWANLYSSLFYVLTQNPHFFNWLSDLHYTRKRHFHLWANIQIFTFLRLWIIAHTNTDHKHFLSLICIFDSFRRVEWFFNWFSFFLYIFLLSPLETNNKLHAFLAKAFYFLFAALISIYVQSTNLSSE